MFRKLVERKASLKFYHLLYLGQDWKMWIGVVLSIWKLPLEIWQSLLQTLRRKRSPRLHLVLLLQINTVRVALALITQRGECPGHLHPEEKPHHWMENLIKVIFSNFFVTSVITCKYTDYAKKYHIFMTNIHAQSIICVLHKIEIC